MFEKLKKWLGSSFICIRCHKPYHLMCFGSGKVICPDCYRNERKWLFLDNFILNKLLIGRIS